MTRQNTSPAPGNGYSANGFPPESKGRVAPGRLFIDLHAVRFVSAQGTVSLPTSGLDVRSGGHNNEQIFFEHPQHPGWSIVSSDPQLLHDPVLRENPAFASKLRAVQKSRTGIPKPVIFGLGFLAICFGLLLLLILQRDRIVNVIVDRIPLSWEEKLGDQVFEQVKTEGQILEDSEWEPKVRQITERLLPIVEQSGYNFRFHIMDDTNVNAFAMPGGNVVILTGLLEAAESAEEVAGVLAHEIAHVTERHSMRQIVQSAGLWVIVSALFGDTSGVTALLMDGSQFLLRQSFSRDFEREADNQGWEYLIAAKIDPRGLTRFFETLKEIYEGAGAGRLESSLAFLNTHPATDERIERLAEKWEELEGKDQFIPFENWSSPP